MDELKAMGVQQLIRFAGDELNFYVDVNAPPTQMISHLARNNIG